MHTYNEPIAAVIVGLLLSLSAGVRVTVPLLAVNLLAFNQVITLPANLAWLGSLPTLIILSVACAAETIVHFVPVAGTYLKASATPLAFAGGTVLMAVPLGDHNPLYQWTLAGVVGGGTAALTNLGVTGARVATTPANVASFGLFGLLWNLGEFLVSLLLIALSALCFVAGILAALAALVVLGALIVFLAVKGVRHWTKPGSVPIATVS